MPGETLELRRSTTRREAVVYLSAFLYAGCAVVGTSVTVTLVRDVVTALRVGVTVGQAVFLVVALVVVIGLVGLLLRWGTPMWQLALRPGSADDVIVTLSRDGMVVRDAGFTITVPWASLGSIRMEPGRGGQEALLPILTGPVRRSRGRLPALVERGMRRGVFRFRLEAQDPTPAEVRDGIEQLSGGTVVVARTA